MAIHLDVKNAAASLDEIDLRAELPLDIGRQPGGPGQVVSLDAVFDGDVHGTLRVFFTVRRIPWSSRGEGGRIRNSEFGKPPSIDSIWGPGSDPHNRQLTDNSSPQPWPVGSSRGRGLAYGCLLVPVSRVGAAIGCDNVNCQLVVAAVTAGRSRSFIITYLWN